MDELIDRALAEDLGEQDLTGEAVVPEEALARGRIEQKAAGVIAGWRSGSGVFRRVDPSLHWTPRAGRGRMARAAARWRRWRGTPARSSPRSAWRSTSSAGCPASPRSRRGFVSAVEGTGARILDTRKTTPGLRSLEKQAVLAGGGHNHRIGLFDAVLVKENHARLAGGVGSAAAARRSSQAPNGVPGRGRVRRRSTRYGRRSRRARRGCCSTT